MRVKCKFNRSVIMQKDITQPIPPEMHRDPACTQFTEEEKKSLLRTLIDDTEGEAAAAINYVFSVY